MDMYRINLREPLLLLREPLRLRDLDPLPERPLKLKIIANN